MRFLATGLVIIVLLIILTVLAESVMTNHNLLVPQ